MILDTMVRPHMTGPATRRAILEELRRLADDGRPGSLALLVDGTGIKRGTIAAQLARLRREGLVQTRHGHGGGIFLTSAGVIATD